MAAAAAAWAVSRTCGLLVWWWPRRTSALEAAVRHVLAPGALAWAGARAARGGQWASVGVALGLVLLARAAREEPWDALGAGLPPPGFDGECPPMVEAFLAPSGVVHAVARADDPLGHRGAVWAWPRRVPCTFAAGAAGGTLTRVTVRGWLQAHHLRCPVPRGLDSLLGPGQVHLVSSRTNTSTPVVKPALERREGRLLLVTVVKATDDLQRTLVPWARWHGNLGVARVLALAIDCRRGEGGATFNGAVEEDGLEVRLWPPEGAHGDVHDGVHEHALESACGLSRSRMQTPALVSSVVRELLSSNPRPEWILHLDVDEYLAPLSPQRSNLATYLDSLRPTVGQVHFLWRFFGPSPASSDSSCLPATHLKAESMARVGALVRDSPPFRDEPVGCPAKAFNRRPVAFKSAVRTSSLRPGIAISPHWFLASGDGKIADPMRDWVLHHYALSNAGNPEARGWTHAQTAHFSRAFSEADVTPWATTVAASLCAAANDKKQPAVPLTAL